jgi:REP element-mobilizing transposase RayT
MARLARIVVPGFPHHVTQRGNRRADVFDSTTDRALFDQETAVGYRAKAFCMIYFASKAIEAYETALCEFSFSIWS